MEDLIFRYKLHERVKDNEADKDEVTLFNKYRDVTLMALFKALDQAREDYNKTTKEERRDYWNMSNDKREALPDEVRFNIGKITLSVLRKLIATRLDVLTDGEANHLEYMLSHEWLNEPLTALQAEVKDLRATLKCHNHEIGGVWTSSARWTR